MSFGKNTLHGVNQIFEFKLIILGRYIFFLIKAERNEITWFAYIRSYIRNYEL